MGYALLERMAKANVDGGSGTCENIYFKIPKPAVIRRGKPYPKMKYTPIAAVVGKRMNSTTANELNPNEPEAADDVAAEYKGAYLLISNRCHSSSEVMGAWVKRWRIEVLFRTAKRELGMLNCHSPYENHIHA